MSTKLFKEMKDLTKEELIVKVREGEQQLFQLKLKKIAGDLKDTASLWRLRKNLARVKMLYGQAVEAKRS